MADFFAKSANNSSPDPHVGLPSAEAIEAEIRPMTYEGADLTECVERVLSLIRPAFEAKDAEIEQLEEMVRREQDAAIHWCGEAAKFNEQRSAAEAKLAQAVEALSRAKDEIVRTADDLSMHSPAVKLIEEIAAIIGQPALNSRAIVKDALNSARSASAAARGETR